MDLINRIERSRNRDELMTFDEALRFFRVSKPALLAALRSGQIPAFKIGRQWRIYKNPLKAGLISRSDSRTISDAERTPIQGDY